MAEQNQDTRLGARKKPVKGFVNHPVGLAQAVLCDVVDLGIVKSNRPDFKDAHKVVLVFQSIETITREAIAEVRPLGVLDEDDEKLIGKRFTVRSFPLALSASEKSNLVKLLGQWRGKTYTEEELNDGVYPEDFIGRNAMLNIVYNPNPEGGVYVNINAVLPFHAKNGMQPIEVTDYVRVKNREPKDGAKGAGAGAPTKDDGKVPF